MKYGLLDFQIFPFQFSNLKFSLYLLTIFSLKRQPIFLILHINYRTRMAVSKVMDQPYYHYLWQIYAYCLCYYHLDFPKASFCFIWWFRSWTRLNLDSWIDPGSCFSQISCLVVYPLPLAINHQNRHHIRSFRLFGLTSILHLCTFSSLIKGFYHRCCPLFRQIRLEVFWELTCLLDQSTDSQASYCYSCLFISCLGFHLHFPLKFDCIHQDQAFPSSCLVYNPKRHQFLLVQCLTLVSRWPPLNFISLLVWEDARYSILASFVREFLI